MAVVWRQVLAKFREIKKTVNVAKQVILRHNIVEIKCVEQLVLRFVVAAPSSDITPAINTNRLSH